MFSLIVFFFFLKRNTLLLKTKLKVWLTFVAFYYKIRVPCLYYNQQIIMIFLIHRRPNKSHFNIMKSTDFRISCFCCLVLINGLCVLQRKFLKDLISFHIPFKSPFSPCFLLLQSESRRMWHHFSAFTIFIFSCRVWWVLALPAFWYDVDC